MDAMTYFELEELAMFLTGLPEERDDELLEVFETKYGVELDDCFALIKDLLNLCMVAKHPNKDNLQQGFATADKWLIHKDLIINRTGG